MTKTTAHTAAASDYTQSPACAMLASNCACCGKELVDAASVETGVGPVCRRKHGYKVPCVEADWATASVLLDKELESGSVAGPGGPVAIVAGDARKACNALTYACALVQGTVKVYALAAIIFALGYHKLAKRITTNAGALKVEASEHPDFGPCLKLTTPYSPELNEALKAHKVWRRWADGKTEVQGVRVPKGRYIALKSRKELWAALSDTFPGMAVIGTKGISTLPGQKAA